MTTRAEARDAILGLVRTAWLADPTSASLPLLYADAGREDPPGDDASGNPGAWARLSVQHTPGASGQASLGTVGNRLFDRVGVFTAQIFTAKGTGLVLSDQLSTIVTDALEAGLADKSVWFKNVSSAEVDQNGAWFQINVTAEFSYREVK